YASGVKGLADLELDALKSKIDGNSEPDITPVFDAIIKNIPAPDVLPDDSFAMLVLALRYDNYKGKIGIGKIAAGSIKKAQALVQIQHDGTKIPGKATSLLQYQGLNPVEVQDAQAGDIVAVAGFDSIQIGETIADGLNPVQIPPVAIEQPTIKMTFGVNTSPFAGREGKFVTSRNLRDRLFKEIETNVALKVEAIPGSDGYLVSGRGELHLGILIETMRREGFELEVSQPQVIYHEEDGQKLEPYEQLAIDVGSDAQGTVIEEVGKRGGRLTHMETAPSGETHLDYIIPTRGLIGLKNALLTKTRGTAIVNNLFDSYEPVASGEIKSNEH